MKDLLKKLISLTDSESPKQGKFRVTLDYDNTHDGARVLNGDGDVLAECYKLPNMEPPECGEWQFIQAIKTACSNAEPDSPSTETAIELIQAERERQVSAEGWTAEHDDKCHTCGSLTGAAACYALVDSVIDPLIVKVKLKQAPDGFLPLWPFEREWWKPTTPIRNLVKAGALIVAEIERRQRAGEEA